MTAVLQSWRSREVAQVGDWTLEWDSKAAILHVPAEAPGERSNGSPTHHELILPLSGAWNPFLTTTLDSRSQPSRHGSATGGYSEVRDAPTGHWWSWHLPDREVPLLEEVKRDVS